MGRNAVIVIPNEVGWSWKGVGEGSPRSDCVCSAVPGKSLRVDSSASLAGARSVGMTRKAATEGAGGNARPASARHQARADERNLVDGGPNRGGDQMPDAMEQERGFVDQHSEDATASDRRLRLDRDT